MALTYGELAAREVSKRIGQFFANEAAMSGIDLQDRDEGALFVASAERTLWIWDPDSTASATSYIVLPSDSPSAGRLVRVDATLAGAVAGLVSDVSGLTCLSGDAVGDFVYLSAASTVAKADADDTAKIPPIGMIVSKETTTSCTVRVSGKATKSGLTAGSIYYLSTTAGGITTTPPATPAAIPVGVAISTTSLLIMPLGPLSYILRSVVANLGADLLGFVDTNSNTANATVGAVLDEILVELKSALGHIPLPPSSWYLLTGAPLAIWSNATTTVPGSDFDSSKCFAIRWNNDAAPAAITRSFQIPPDMDITSNPVLHFQVAKVGATNDAANTTTLAVGLFNQVDAALINADTDFGGASSALTPNATSLTQQNLTRTITASDLAAYPASVTITVKPTAGTLDTDDLVFVNAYVVYKRKLRTS